MIRPAPAHNLPADGQPQAAPVTEGAVTVYIVDRELPGITLDQLGHAQRAAIRESLRFTANGRPIRYLRSTFVPAEAHCMCLFDAEDASTVEELNREARIPFTRVVEAIEMSPPT